MKQKVQTALHQTSASAGVDPTPLLTLDEAMAVIQFLDVRGKLCSHCGYRRATGSSVYSRVCKVCHETAKGSAFKPLIGADAITTKLDDFLLKKLARWVEVSLGEAALG